MSGLYFYIDNYENIVSEQKENSDKISDFHSNIPREPRTIYQCLETANYPIEEVESYIRFTCFG